VGLIQSDVAEQKKTHPGARACGVSSERSVEKMSFNQSQRSRVRSKAFVVALLLATILLAVSSASAQNAGGNTAFGFNSDPIFGFNDGSILLTGGGAVNFNTKDVHAGGSFSCLEDVTLGPLAGCKGGEGVRWDTENLLSSVGFKCTGAAEEVKKTATSNADTIVLESDFYRAGNGNEASFSAQMIVSSVDLAPEIPGIQNIWIEKLGCGSAIVNFNH
jgi:hypothetical protein